MRLDPDALRRARERRGPDGWSQARLAQAVGCHRFTISRYETGRRGDNIAPETLRKLAAALRVPQRSLLRRGAA